MIPFLFGMNAVNLAQKLGGVGVCSIARQFLANTPNACLKNVTIAVLTKHRKHKNLI